MVRLLRAVVGARRGGAVFTHSGKTFAILDLLT